MAKAKDEASGIVVVKETTLFPPISQGVPEVAAAEPVPETPELSGASDHLDGSYNLGTSFTTSAMLERAIITHMDQFGKEVTSRELMKMAKEMLA